MIGNGKAPSFFLLEVLAGLLILSSGCAYQKVEALSQKVAEQQRQISILQREDIEIKSRLEEQKTANYLLDKRMKELGDRLGDSQARLQTLEIGVGELKGMLEEVKSLVAKPAAPPSAPVTAAPPEVKPGPPPPQPTPEVAPLPPGRLGSEELYNEAMRLLRAGEMGEAIGQFEKYVREYPHSELADNAQYWIGEAYYAQKDYDRARKEFEKVISDFPRGDKVPDALLKIGFCYLETGQKEKGKAELRKVVSQYPKSPAASLAKKKLGELSR
jgi:tol-pal system protein YbgF